MIRKAVTAFLAGGPCKEQRARESVINKRHARLLVTQHVLTCHFFFWPYTACVLFLKKYCIYNSRKRYKVTMNPWSKASVEFKEEKDPVFGSRGRSPHGMERHVLSTERRPRCPSSGQCWAPWGPSSS